MDHLEMVEKLREKANVSYEEATAALEACDWDLLDALLMLESKGRLQELEEAAYSTKTEKKEEPSEKAKTAKRQSGVFAQLLHGLARVIKKCNTVNVQIVKKGEERLSLPLTVVALLLVFMFWWVLIAAAIAMLCGYRFSVSGLSIDKTVNSAMEKAGDFVDNVVKPEDVKIVINRRSEEDGDDE